jgi:hypothetical protein
MSGEGQELYKKAVEAGDLSVYKDGMQAREDEIASKDAKFFGGDIDAAKERIRSSQQFWADRDNEEYERIKNNLERPVNEVQREATAIQDMAIQKSLRDRGSDSPTSEEYQGAQDTFDKISDRIDAASRTGNDSGFDLEEIKDRHGSEAELRALITPEIQGLILEVADSKYPEFLGRYKEAKAVEEKSKKSSSFLVAPEISQFYEDFKASLLEDSRIVSISNDPKIKEALNLWAERYYKKELTDNLNREMQADNYSI